MQNSSTTILPQPLQSNSNKDHSKICHKIEIITITFLAYTSVHAIRTSYSFSKSQLPDQIEVDSKYIGFVDSAMLLFLGLGNFIIAVYPLSRPIRSVCIALFACALQYCLIPISMTFLKGFTAFLVLLVLMSLNGFIQSFVWPNILTLVHTVATPETDGAILGFWATNGNFGNIIGFIISQLFILDLDLNWQYSAFITAAYMLIIAIIMTIRIQEIPNALQPQKSQNNTRKKSDQIQILSNQPSLKQFCKSPNIILTALSFSLLKSVMYGILLWLPLYFHEIGLIDYQLYIPMMFDASSICGSIILGAIFKRLAFPYKNGALIPCLFLLIIFFSLLKKVDFTVGGYFAIIGCVGFCLGGSYNTMTSLVTMQLVTNIQKSLQQKYLRFYSASMMAIGYIITALTQIVIGLTVAENENSLFQVFLIYTLINLISVIVLVAIDCKNSSNQPLSQKIRINSQNSLKTSLIENDLQIKSEGSLKNSQIQMIKPNNL